MVDETTEDIDIEIDDDETIVKTVEAKDDEVNPNVADQLANTSTEGTQTIEDRYKAFQEADPELADYHGKNVKKRIDKMTYKLREGERQTEEAINYAQGVLQQKTELETRLEKQDGAFIGEHITRLQTEVDAAKQAHYDAYNANDPEGMGKATEAIARASSQLSNAEITDQRFKRKQEEGAGRVAPTYQPQQTQQSPQQTTRQIDPKAEAWADRNEWFGTDEEVTKGAMSIHKQLINEGMLPSSSGYYAKIDERLRLNYPDKEYWGKEVSTTPNPAEVTTQVTPVNNSVTTNRGKRNTVRLTASQLSVAKKLGITPQQYAKSLQAMEQ